MVRPSPPPPASPCLARSAGSSSSPPSRRSRVHAGRKSGSAVRSSAAPQEWWGSPAGDPKS
eukprot:9480333-Pyramimonas_sp.AAC.1